MQALTQKSVDLLSIFNKNLCGRDGRTIRGPQCVPKSTSVTLAVDEKTLPMATITGRTDRRTDRQTDRVRRNMRPPPREERRIITLSPVAMCRAACRQSLQTVAAAPVPHPRPPLSSTYRPKRTVRRLAQTQPIGENPNSTHTMRMTSSKCVLQQRHLLGYKSESEP